MITIKEAEGLIREKRWSMAIRATRREDCSEDYRRNLFKSLIFEKLIFLNESFFEQSEHDCFSSLSIYQFFRMCYVLRRDLIKGSIPDVVYFGRDDKGGLIEVLITKEFKIFLRYDDSMHHFLIQKKTKQIKIMFGMFAVFI